MNLGITSNFYSTNYKKSVHPSFGMNIDMGKGAMGIIGKYYSKNTLAKAFPEIVKLTTKEGNEIYANASRIGETSNIQLSAYDRYGNETGLIIVKKGRNLFKKLTSLKRILDSQINKAAIKEFVKKIIGVKSDINPLVKLADSKRILGSQSDMDAIEESVYFLSNPKNLHPHR